jgi:uncharacterized protein (TIGR02147 family)
VVWAPGLGYRAASPNVLKQRPFFATTERLVYTTVYKTVAPRLAPAGFHAITKRVGRRTSINVFAYLDYRAFLRDFYTDRKTNGRGFSYRAFSARAGLRSPNYLKLVIDGKRNLTHEVAQRFGEACDMEGEALSYFCNLVSFNQAQGPTRQKLYTKLLAYRRYRAAHRLDVAHAEYHSNWYLPAIRELASHPEFRDDPEWIANMLVPTISVAEAKSALRVLEELGLLVRASDGQLQQRDVVVSTGPEMRALHIATYHRSMLERASEAIDLVEPEHRDISSVTMLVSHNGLAELKERVRRFRKELIELAQEQADPEVVAQINLQLFPLSRTKNRGQCS